MFRSTWLLALRSPSGGTSLHYLSLSGLIYFVTAVVCLRLHPTRGMTFAVLVGCLLLSASLCLFNFGIGLFASVTLVPLLVAAFPRPTSSQN